MSETICPLCNAPRPAGASRCICNYTFEYGPPMRASGGRANAATASMTRIVYVVAAIAAVVVCAGVLAAGSDQRQSSDGLVPMIMLGGGLFAFAGAATGWSWFFASTRARRFVWLFGAGGARVFYALIGGGLVGGGAGLLVG